MEQFLAHQAPAAVRLQHHRGVEGGCSQTRRGRDRLQHGQSRSAHATPHRGQDDRDGTARRYPSLLGVQGHPAAAQGDLQLVPRRFAVELDADREAIVTIGSKEGIAHLALATLDAGDIVLVPNPSYPIHIYGPVISGADIRHVRMLPGVDFFDELTQALKDSYPEAQDADPELPEQSHHPVRGAGVLRAHRGDRAGSTASSSCTILPTPTSSSTGTAHPRSCKSRRQRGRGRVLHHVEELQHGRLARRVHGRQPRPGGSAGAHQELPRLRDLHSHPGGVDPGAGGAPGVRGADPPDLPEAARRAVRRTPRAGLERRDPEGLDVHLGADPARPIAGLGSLEFAKKLLADAKVAVSPGIGFGQYGDDHVRFSLIENEASTRQALRGIKEMLRKDGLIQLPAAAWPRHPSRARQAPTMEIVRITDEERRIVEPDLLPLAEPVHRQLRPDLPADYLGKMGQIFAAGGEMCVAVIEQSVVGVAVFRSYENTHAGKRSTSTTWSPTRHYRSSGVGHALLGYPRAAGAGARRRQHRPRLGHPPHARASVLLSRGLRHSLLRVHEASAHETHPRRPARRGYGRRRHLPRPQPQPERDHPACGPGYPDRHGRGPGPGSSPLRRGGCCPADRRRLRGGARPRYRHRDRVDRRLHRGQGPDSGRHRAGQARRDGQQGTAGDARERDLRRRAAARA